MENLTITIKNAASFNEEGATLKLEKQHTTLVYGLNGTGKTTISNFLQSKEQQEEQYEDCSLEGFDPNNQKILVYNRKFIEENFYEHDTQKGIFNLKCNIPQCPLALEETQYMVYMLITCLKMMLNIRRKILLLAVKTFYFFQVHSSCFVSSLLFFLSVVL